MADHVMTDEELESLVVQCQDASFRADLATSCLWEQVEDTMRKCLSALDGAICVVAADPVDSDSVEMDERSSSDMDDGLGYTLHVPRSNGSDQVEVEPRNVVVQDKQVVRASLESATSCVRFLRNACRTSPANQDACCEHHLLELAHEFIMRCVEWIDVEDTSVKSLVVLLCQIALQFSTNAIASRPSNQAVVWALFFPMHFQRILVECHEHRKIVAFAAALLLNCVSVDDADASIAQRRLELVGARDLIATLLQRTLLHPDAPELAAGAGGPESPDPAFEWIYLLFSAQFQAGHVQHLYDAVGASILSRLWSRVTPEQLILLRVVVLYANAQHVKATANEQASQGNTNPDSRTHAQATLLSLWEFATQTWYSLIAPMEEDDRPNDVDEARQAMWVELEKQAKLLVLDLLGEVALASTHHLPPESAENVLLSLLAELQHAWETRHLQPTAPSSRTDNSPIMEPEGYRSALIRAVGNLCFRHAKHQDLVRDHGYLPLFLNHCNIDEHNPLMREWSLVALRNLCEGNQANQEFIAALQPQGMDASSSLNLEKMNLHAEVDDHGHVAISKQQ